MSDELRGKLTQSEDNLRSLREDKAEAIRKREAAKDHYREVIANEGDEPAAHDAAMEAQRAVGTLEEQILAEESSHSDLLTLLDNKEVGLRNGTKPSVRSEGAATWSSEAILADPEIQRQLSFISSTKSKIGSIALGEVASREILAADVSPTAKQRQSADQGLIPRIDLRPLSFLNLLPTGTTDGNLVPYTQETGPLTGAAEVAEGALKPEAGITFVDKDAPIRTIAAWMKIRKQALADFASLRTIIDTRLRYLVQRRLEAQVIAGDGIGENLTGLLNTSGTAQVAFSATVPLTELVLSGITAVMLSEGDATGIVMNPLDWQTTLTEKAHFGGGAGAASTAGSYEYVSGGPYSVTPQSLWGVTCVPSSAMPQGVALVADFALAVTLLIREGVNVLISDSDQDDFLRNRVTMLGEMRAGLPVWRPQVIAEVDLSAA